MAALYQGSSFSAVPVEGSQLYTAPSSYKILVRRRSGVQAEAAPLRRREPARPDQHLHVGRADFVDALDRLAGGFLAAPPAGPAADSLWPGV